MVASADASLSRLLDTVVRKNSADRQFIRCKQRYEASPYLVDFEVGRNFQSHDASAAKFEPSR